MKHPEDDMSKAFASYLGMHKSKPLFSHIPNGGKRAYREAARFKAMGVLKGMPDYLIFTSTRYNNGLAVELKVKPNKPSPEQLDVLKKMRDQGWVTRVCYSIDEAIDCFENYIQQP